jgi:hypothetical protein
MKIDMLKGILATNLGTNSALYKDVSTVFSKSISNMFIRRLTVNSMRKIKSELVDSILVGLRQLSKRKVIKIELVSWKNS